MNKTTYNLLVLAAVLLFVGLNGLFVFHNRNLLMLLPPALFVVLLLVFAPNFVFYSLFFLAPLSIPLHTLVADLDFDLWLPTEPLILALLLVLVLKSLYHRYFEQNLCKSPIFWSIAIYLAIMLIAIFASEMPLVSLKYWLSRFWFIAIFFYLSYLFLRSDLKRVNLLMGLYLFGFAIVVTLIMVRQVRLGLLNRYVAQTVCQPFFPDHTSYGAALAFVIPISLALARSAARKLRRLIFYGLSLFFAVALVLTYTRAAWLSVLVGVGVWFCWRLRIKFRSIVLVGAVLLGLVLAFWGDITRWMQRNDTASTGTLREQVISITNITTDASNVERLNRWSCALQMIAEKPIFGFGPGTYQFLYAPYQHSWLLTSASSFRGELGNAHSEYLGLMSESGIPAGLAFIAIVVFALVVAFKICNTQSAGNTRNLAVGLLVGLVTYITHGLLNNFLDMDKLAILFWTAIAFFVAAREQVVAKS